MTAVTYRVPSAVLTEREHVVPLDHSKPDGPKITVFSRELAHPDGLDKPYLIFQQGGPGFEATRPTAPPSGWQKRAIADYRVLLIDQRGVGRSTPVADIPGDDPEAQAEYLTHFRADSIVRDAELIRQDRFEATRTHCLLGGAGDLRDQDLGVWQCLREVVVVS